MLEITIAASLGGGLFGILGACYNIPWWVIGVCGATNGVIIATVA